MDGFNLNILSSWSFDHLVKSSRARGKYRWWYNVTFLSNLTSTTSQFGRRIVRNFRSIWPLFEPCLPLHYIWPQQFITPRSEVFGPNRISFLRHIDFWMTFDNSWSRFEKLLFNLGFWFLPSFDFDAPKNRDIHKRTNKQIFFFSFICFCLLFCFDLFLFCSVLFCFVFVFFFLVFRYCLFVFVFFFFFFNSRKEFWQRIIYAQYCLIVPELILGYYIWNRYTT